MRRQLVAAGSGYGACIDGDAGFAVFPSAEAAARFCLRLQLVLLHAPWPAGLLKAPHAAPQATRHQGAVVTLWRGLRVACGFHFGAVAPVLDMDTGIWVYDGDEVVYAHAVASAARPGDVLCSAEAYAELLERLADICPDVGPVVGKALKPVGGRAGPVRALHAGQVPVTALSVCAA